MKVTSLDLPSGDITAVDQYEAELPEQAVVEDICEGVKAWHNAINNFYVMRLHRSADPAKRSQDWANKTKNSGIDLATYLREYELHWESLDGKAVYSDEYSREFHVSRSSLGWNPRLAVCRGWDFGLYPACVFAQLHPFSRLLVLREAVGVDIDTERFIDEISRLSGQWFPGASFYEFVDPTGRNRAGTDGRSYTRLLTAKPLRAKRVTLGLNAPVARRTAVVDFLKTNVKGQPSLLIDPSCETLIKGFGGGYLYKYMKGTLKAKPEKNIFSHIHDALQYLCSKVRSANLKLDEASDNEKVVVEPRFGGRTPPSPHTMTLKQPISGGLTYGR